MIWVLFACLLLGSAEASASVASNRFAEIARQAEQARKSDHLSEALQSYRQALQLRPTWGEGWWSLGGIYYDQDRYAEAQEAFRRYIQLGNKVEPAYAFLGLCEYETREYEHATEHLRYWIGKGGTGSKELVDVAVVRWAELLTREGRFFESLYLLDKAVERRGPDPVLVEAMGLAWMHMKNVPEDYPQERREMVWLAGSAGAWMSAQKLDRAHEFLDQLATYYGEEPNVHFLRGFVFETEKRDDEAKQEYRQELKLSPRYTVAMAKLALLDVQAGELNEAEEIARKAVAVEPENAQAHYALGRVFLARNQWAEGARELELAKQIAPASSKVRFHLAKAYRKLGRAAEAEHESAEFETLKNKEDGLEQKQGKLRMAVEGKEQAK